MMEGRTEKMANGEEKRNWKGEERKRGPDVRKVLSMAPVYMAFLRFMGDENDARNYSYSLEVGGNGRKLIWEGTPRSIRDGHRKVRDSHDGLIIQRNMALFFSGGDRKELKLRVTGRIWKEALNPDGGTCIPNLSLEIDLASPKCLISKSPAREELCSRGSTGSFFGKELLANCFNFRLGQQLRFPSGEYEYAPPSEQNSQLQYWRIFSGLKTGGLAVRHP
ncbi:hypothetical protein LXL04_029119 [Taraxacum kok-saghyz]